MQLRERSVATPSELFDWQVRYLDIYLLYEYAGIGELVKMRHSFIDSIISLRMQHASPRLCSRLPASLRQLHTNLPDSNSPPTMTGTSSFINSPLLSSVIPSLFYFRLKTFCFCKFLPPLPFFFFSTDSSDSLDYYQYF